MPDEYPIDLGGVRAEWHGTDLWLKFPKAGCEGRVVTAGPGAWAVISRDPLTLHPSVKVSGGAGGAVVLVHGWVKDGRWSDCGDGQFQEAAP